MTITLQKPNDGAVLGVAFDNNDATAIMEVGKHVRGTDGTIWQYAKAAAAITGRGYPCYIDKSGNATMLTTSNASGKKGVQVGLPGAAIDSGYYGFFQVYGPASVRVKASCAAAVAINTTATGGELDDDATTGASVIDNVKLTTANGGAAALADGYLNWPVIGAVL